MMENEGRRSSSCREEQDWFGSFGAPVPRNDLPETTTTYENDEQLTER